MAIQRGVKFGTTVLVVLVVLNLCVAEDKIKASVKEGGTGFKEGGDDEVNANNPPYGNSASTSADSHHHIPRHDFNNGGGNGGG